MWISIFQFNHFRRFFKSDIKASVPGEQLNSEDE